jgi:hypothetical protein
MTKSYLALSFVHQVTWKFFECAAFTAVGTGWDARHAARGRRNNTVLDKNEKPRRYENTHYIPRKSATWTNKNNAVR